MSAGDGDGDRAHMVAALKLAMGCNTMSDVQNAHMIEDVDSFITGFKKHLLSGLTELEQAKQSAW